MDGIGRFECLCPAEFTGSLCDEPVSGCKGELLILLNIEELISLLYYLVK